MLTEIEEQLTAYMIGKGITPDEDLILGPDISRFHIAGDSPGKQNGWVVLIEGDFPTAHFGSWKTGQKFMWQQKKPSTPAERVAAQKAAREAKAKYQSGRAFKNAQAKENARTLWDKAQPADRGHAYLFEKQIGPNGARQLDGALLVPLFYGGEIVSLQCIYPTGQKIFLKGGQVRDCYYRIGDNPAAIYVCEGFATACAIFEQYDATVYAAFTAANLCGLARDLALDYPGAELIIMADNDSWTKGNPGVTYARKAARLSGASVVIPNFEGLDVSDKPTDFLDYIRLGGSVECVNTRQTRQTHHLCGVHPSGSI